MKADIPQRYIFSRAYQGESFIYSNGTMFIQMKNECFSFITSRNLEEWDVC